MSFSGYEMLRLPHANHELFEHWPKQHYPEKKEKVLGRIRSVRGGKLNDSRFGSRMRGDGIIADPVAQMFDVARRKASLPEAGHRSFHNHGKWAVNVAAESISSRVTVKTALDASAWPNNATFDIREKSISSPNVFM